MQFVPNIMNDVEPTQEGYGRSWQVVNYLDADDVRFTGTYAECEQFIGTILPADGPSLETVLARLYRSEINVSISTFWDGGWDVKLGDDMNGFEAETTIFCPSGDISHQRTLEDVRAGLAQVACWLDGVARERYPESQYATEEDVR